MKILLNMFAGTVMVFIFLIISILVDDQTIITASYIFALLFGLYVVVQLIESGYEISRENYRSAMDLANTLSKLHPDQWNVLGLHFPTLSMSMFEGEVIEMFENTKATVKQFIHFLETSNAETISPERNWNSSDYPRWAWREIYEWLKNKKYIFENSARGNHSWLWRGNSYRHLCKYWFARSIPNMQEVEGDPPPIGETVAAVGYHSESSG